MYSRIRRRSTRPYEHWPLSFDAANERSACSEAPNQRLKLTAHSGTMSLASACRRLRALRQAALHVTNQAPAPLERRPNRYATQRAATPNGALVGGFLP